MYGVSEGPLKSWSSPGHLDLCRWHRLLQLLSVFLELPTTNDDDLRLLSVGTHSTNIIMFLSGSGFSSGCSPHSPLFAERPRHVRLQSGLSTFPEAFGVMMRTQFASRLIYPRVGPRRHVTGGLLGLALCMLALTQVSVTTNLWYIQALMMFVVGWMMAQVMVPNQAASFAMITPESMGRASTFFNTMRQVGKATGVAILSTVLIGVGSAEAGSSKVAQHHGLPPGLLHGGRLRTGGGGLRPDHPRQRRGRDDRAPPPTEAGRAGTHSRHPGPPGSDA